MCGIIGVLGPHDAPTLILEGLKRLEYRGYDSAGIAVLDHGVIERRRAVGKIKALEQKLQHEPLPATSILGIGHTRWATHGSTTEDNAHPHGNEHLAVVHNGIIENFEELRAELQAKGYVFHTETDTEAVVHLLTDDLKQGQEPLQAVQTMLSRLEGAFALGIIFRTHPHMMIAARRGSPLAIGFGDQGVFLGSDALAIGPYIHHIMYLEENDWAVLSSDGAQVYNVQGHPVQREKKPCTLSQTMIGKQNYRHFMLKEIHEQPTVIAEALRSYLGYQGEALKASFPLDWKDIQRIHIVACGTSLYAGQIAQYWFEQLCRIPVECDIASEFRYRQPPLSDRTLYLFISQSGETIDTLAACQYVGSNALTAALVNVVESSLARQVKHVWPLHSGPEIGVASTKAFMNQLNVLMCLVLAAAQDRGTLSEQDHETLRHHLNHVPSLLAEALTLNAQYESWAHLLVATQTVLYLGRGSLFPLALEGALKLKELSYIHAEGFAAGEMKHGPIALIDEHVPVVVLCPSGELFEKTVSNIHEVKARGAQTLVLTDLQGAERLHSISRVIALPQVHPVVTPFLYTPPLQLLAYHTAVLKGSDVDQPRNLAKSVTVE